MTHLAILEEERSLPEGHGADRIVQWHVFRSRPQAERFADGIHLGAGQELVGGFTRDSLGILYWVGAPAPGRTVFHGRTTVTRH
jgi:hypothetical protein